MRAAGQHPDQRRHRAHPIDDYLPKIEELVVRSQGRIRADAVHKRQGVTPHDLPPTLTVVQAAKILGCGRSLAYDLIRRNEFPSPVLRLDAPLDSLQPALAGPTSLAPPRD